MARVTLPADDAAGAAAAGRAAVAAAPPPLDAAAVAADAPGGGQGDEGGGGEEGDAGVTIMDRTVDTICRCKDIPAEDVQLQVVFRRRAPWPSPCHSILSHSPLTIEKLFFPFSPFPRLHLHHCRLSLSTTVAYVRSSRRCLRSQPRRQ